ncbi:helix-turn-helix domain-containing protein [Streptomyces goshikiensis]|uniref:helix-turn-helix domain-containing protein n=1 Tax=Streptomyces goshikiensis TaxID=1942 RepID=UPI0036C188AC
MSDLFDAIDRLLARPADLPAPEVRLLLRRADGLTQEQVANVLGVSRLSFLRWESGQVDPRPRHRAAYSRLLDGWAVKYPGVAQTDRNDNMGEAAVRAP